VASFTRTTKSGRLRIAAAAVLLAGIVVAAIYYSYKVRQPPDDPNALLPRYQRDMEHEIGVQMGTMGEILLTWQQTLAEPGAQAIIIAGVAALLAGGFYRAAWVIEEEERERGSGPGE
jgi:hypothetical protein